MAANMGASGAGGNQQAVNVGNGMEADVAKVTALANNKRMQTLELDGKDWKSEKEFFDALALALGSFDGHGRNADAFEETMIYRLELNTVQPPYEVIIRNASKKLLPFLRKFALWIAEARQDRRDDAAWGDVEVVITVA